MTVVLAVALFAGGLLLGALVAALVARRLREADVARAVADAESRLRAGIEGLTVQRDAEARRGAELVRDLDYVRAMVAERDAALQQARERLASQGAAQATFEARLEELGRNKTQLEDSFRSLCAQALQSNNEQFLQLARTELERVRVAAQADLQQKESAIASLLAPIRDGLGKYDEKVQQIELDRAQSFAALAQRLDIVSAASDKLAAGTNDLTRALRSSNVRGAWGELQLRRVVELAGMQDHCDFETQLTVTDGDARQQRPDLVVRLPGDGIIVVDAKTPATDLLEAVNQADEAAQHQACESLVAKIRGHVKVLREKAYWNQFPRAPEFVVLFLPSEAFLTIALTHDRAFFEECFQHKVLIATPTTLIALLKTAALGWRQEAIARNAQEISELGKQLYERIAKVAEHLGDVGAHLEKSVKSYNLAVGSIESRLLVTGRRFRDLGAGMTKEIEVLEPIAIVPATLGADELRVAAGLLPPALGEGGGEAVVS